MHLYRWGAGGLLHYAHIAAALDRPKAPTTGPVPEMVLCAHAYARPSMLTSPCDVVRAQTRRDALRSPGWRGDLISTSPTDDVCSARPTPLPSWHVRRSKTTAFPDSLSLQYTFNGASSASLVHKYSCARDVCFLHRFAALRGV
ncbi:hypothetical protein OH77DRAFT_73790 [Trametes cingulata]|nr:hypothetical protein OH77DRAFT_73790 [Trametes cingulata]